jgi:virginiamycin B lyase
VQGSTSGLALGPRRWVLPAIAVAIAFIAALAVTSRADAFVYWANTGPSFDGTTIGRANLNGTSVNHSFITGADGPCGVAVNGTHVFWSNSGLGTGPNVGTIGRANLDGTGANQSLVSAPDNPCGVAVDGGHVYWADGDRVSLGRANLNGSAPQPDFISPVPACGVAVDGSHIYWGNAGSDSIGRANLDGTGVDTTFISGGDNPCGVAVDGSHIYWANSGPTFDGTTIGRANLNGTGVNQSFITGAHGPCGVAVDGARIYWANFATDAIGRAKLDGTGANQTFISGANAPCGVALDSGFAKTTPILTTRASRAIVVGGVVRDTAKLTRGSLPHGNITFRLYGPGDTNCSRAPVFTDKVTVTGNGDYRGGLFRPKQAGRYRFTAGYSGDARNLSVLRGCNAPGESVLMKKGTPKLTTRASVVDGNRIGDAGILIGGYHPTGQIAFRVYGPGDANCSQQPLFGDVVTVSGNAHYHSHRFIATKDGRYRFTATYRGDGNNRPARSLCNAPGESVTVGG